MYHSSDIYKGIVIELLWKLVTGLNMSLICCRVFVINYEFLNTQTVAILMELFHDYTTFNSIHSVPDSDWHSKRRTVKYLLPCIAGMEEGVVVTV